jgi:hypothetical protein
MLASWPHSKYTRVAAASRPEAADLKESRDLVGPNVPLGQVRAVEPPSVRPRLRPQHTLLEDDVHPLALEGAGALDEDAAVRVLRKVELKQVLDLLNGLREPTVCLQEFWGKLAKSFSEREGVDSGHGLSYNVGMSKIDVQTVQEVRNNLRKLGDEVWAVAKVLDDRESSSRLKALSSQIHHEAYKLGG